MPDIPHFDFPFRRGPDGKPVTVEQDDPDGQHIMACENVIVRCPSGWRLERPEFGWPFPEFRTIPLNLNALSAALAEYEPRGNANAQQWADEADAAITHIGIEVGIHG